MKKNTQTVVITGDDVNVTIEVASIMGVLRHGRSLTIVVRDAQEPIKLSYDTNEEADRNGRELVTIVWGKDTARAGALE